jgi:hypothetical protein
MTDQKKPYKQPMLIIHGDVEKITQQGHQANADLPLGNNNTAFSPG